MDLTKVFCSNCGRSVPPDAPASLCPTCLVRGGFGPDESSAESDVDPKSTLHIVIPEGTAFPEGAPKRVGSYELLQVIAHGGMGVVYKARHTGLDRIVAVKMIRSGVLASPSDVERFRREAKSAAKLHHPNIVTIHDIGQQDGQHYFSMDYVPGENLADRARRTPLSPRQAAEITASVAAAIHYAHEHGVLHRDIKPANVIVTPEQQPKVLDFGLALVLSDDSKLTLAGTPVGSPPYMSPEQAAGQSRRVDVRSDVYSLGALLYELLTGRPPFQAASTLETLRLVLTNDAVTPRRLNPALPRDLETICLKCLEKDPGRRYQSAKELGDDLGRFIRDEPIRARPVPHLEKLWHLCRRKPLLVSLGATSLGLLLCVAIGSPIALYHINQERQKSEDAKTEEALQRNKAQESARHARRLLYAADMNLAQQSLQKHNLGRARRLLDDHRPAPGQEDLRGWEWRYLWHHCQSDALAVLVQRGTPASSVDFSADGKLIGAGYIDGRVELWDARTRKLLRTVHPGDGSHTARLAFSPQSNFLAATAEPGTIKMHDLSDGHTTNLRRDPESLVRHLSYSRDGARLAAHMHPRNGALLAAYIHPKTGNLPVTNASVVIFDTAELGPVGTNAAIGTADSSGVATVLSPDHRRLYIGNVNFRFRRCTIHCVDLVTGGEIWSVDAGEDDGLTALAVSPNGQVLASGTGEADPVIRVWDTRTGKLLQTLDEHTGWVSHLAFSPDGSRLASASADQSLRIWDTDSWMELKVLRGHSDEVRAVAFSPDGEILVSGGKDGAIMLWDLSSQQSSRSYQPAPQDVMWVEKLDEETNGLLYVTFEY